MMLMLKGVDPHPLLFRGNHSSYSDMWIEGETGDQLPTHRFIFGVSPLLLLVLSEIPASKEPSLILPDISERAISHLLTFLRCGFVDTDGEEDSFALQELLQLLDIDQQSKCKEIDNVGGGGEEYAENGTGVDPIKQEKVETGDEESEVKGAEHADNNEPDHIPAPAIMYTCQQCESYFSSPQFLNKHIKQMHKQGDLRCDQCTYCTNNKGNFKRHVDTKHEKLLKFQCDLCSMKFGQAPDMEKHKNVAHYKLKSFVCDQCGEAFACKQYLAAHVKRMHSAEKPYCCGKCAIAFVSSLELKRHEKQKHDTKG